MLWVYIDIWKLGVLGGVLMFVCIERVIWKWMLMCVGMKFCLDVLFYDNGCICCILLCDDFD